MRGFFGFKLGADEPEEPRATPPRSSPADAVAHKLQGEPSFLLNIHLLIFCANFSPVTEGKSETFIFVGLLFLCAAARARPAD